MVLAEKIIYKNTEIIYVDYRMKTLIEMEALLTDSLVKVKDAVDKDSFFYLLIDMRGVPVTKEFLSKLTEGAKEYVPFVAKSAVLGISGVKRLFFEMYVLFTKSSMRSFQEKEEALEYLAS